MVRVGRGCYGRRWVRSCERGGGGRARRRAARRWYVLGLCWYVLGSCWDALSEATTQGGM